MGYFWLNSNSKWRATLSPQFEALTKGCERARRGGCGTRAENEMFICLVPYTSSAAFSGQCNSHHLQSSEQSASGGGGTGAIMAKNKILCIYLKSNNYYPTLTCVFTEAAVRFISCSQLQTVLMQAVGVFDCKLTRFPVPGFQWYPNTSSRFTVLLFSTSLSNSSWEEKSWEMKCANLKPASLTIERESSIPWTVEGSARIQGNR